LRATNHCTVIQILNKKGFNFPAKNLFHGRRNRTVLASVPPEFLVSPGYNSVRAPFLSGSKVGKKDGTFMLADYQTSNYQTGLSENWQIADKKNCRCPPLVITNFAITNFTITKFSIIKFVIKNLANKHFANNELVNY